LKLVSLVKEAGPQVGVLVEGQVVDLGAARAALGGESLLRLVLADANAFLEAGRAALEAAARVVEFAQREGEWMVPVDRVRLAAPVPAPRKLFALAGNYAAHIMEGGARLEEADKATPRIFMKPPSTTVRGPRDPIVITEVTRAIDWEAELGVVIGRQGKHIPPDEALDYVAGYTCVNDVSERKLLIKERPESRDRDRWFDWLNGKWLDSFAPMGPCLVTADEIPDPHTLDLTLHVNDELMQNANTGQMIFRVEEIIAYISAIVTLEPGDVISTGTAAGVGSARGIFLQPGDVVRTAIAGIGEMVNPVVAGR
jgi:2-keto-4-pentenoate hydratase/2-oxohepta-3-ene-1,7-dioic acid hydratase in catechol pathway